MHKELVNHLGGLSLPRKSVVRLTDPSPNMTLDVYRAGKTTTQQQLLVNEIDYSGLSLRFSLSSISSQRPAFFSLTLLSGAMIHRHTEIRK